MQRFFLDLYRTGDGKSKMTKGGIEKTEHDFDQREAQLEKESRYLRIDGRLLRDLSELAEAAESGDGEAVKKLVDIANYAVGFISIIEQKHPELARQAASTQLSWPVLLDCKPGWQEKAGQRIAALKLSSGFGVFRVQFRNARGCDDIRPARLWAKGAIRAVEETRIRILEFGRILKGFGSAENLADWCIQRGWGMNRTPKWAATVASTLGLTKENLASWKEIIRRMIREEIPEFQNDPAWSNQRTAAKMAGRATKGEIQNRVLDDICDALESLVPNEPSQQVPEFTGRVPANGKGEADFG
jgi:hypothetical protein